MEGRPTTTQDGAGRYPILPSTAVLIVFVALVAAVYLADPDGIGGAFAIVAGMSLLLASAVGPLWRGVGPRPAWMCVTAAGVFLAAATLDDVEPFASCRVGPFEYGDVATLVAYSLLLTWFAMLIRFVSDRDRSAMFDTGAACVGATLALWVTILAPLSTVDDLATGIVWTAYPPLDVAMIVFAVHLCLASGRAPLPLRWLVTGLLLWLLTDSIYAVQQVHLAEGHDVPALELLYLLAHACVARAFTHPALAELSPAAEDRPPSGTRGRRAAIVLFTGLPAVIATAIPEVGTVDTIVRTVLLALIVALLFVRITGTMTALSDARAESQWRATHDPLTGLLNRAALVDAVAEQRRRDAVTGARTVVLFLDCDDFKRVNDTWGHLAGDTLLVDLARRLPGVLREGERAARNGGDEFVVVSSARNDEDALDLGRRVRRAFESPLRVRDDRVHSMTPSIGIAFAAPGDRCSTDDLLGRADAAMYAGKQRGKGRTVVFGENLARLTHARAAIGDRLGQVAASEPWDIELQPVMSGPGLRTRCGWEVFPRWHDEVLGEVPPEVFLPVADQLGLLPTLGAGVVRRACEALTRLREASPGEDLWISIDVSPAELRDPGYGAAVVDAVREAGLTPGSLSLELTEATLSDVIGVAGVLMELREAGVRIVVDDYGEGAASLGMLTRLPIDGVKIHRCLVVGIDGNPAARERLGAVIALLRTLGLHHIVATGVENPIQERVLVEMGCPAAQGWLYGPELAVEEVVAAALRDQDGLHDVITLAVPTPAPLAAATPEDLRLTPP